MSITTESTTTSTTTMIITPKPPRYHNSTWQLLSQGAEARIWLIPNFITIQPSPNNNNNTKNNNNINNNNNNNNSTTSTTPTTLIQSVICKERFVKSYRHPMLNNSLTKSRTKAEVKSLNRCRRGGVSVPIVLGVDIPLWNHKSNNNNQSNDNNNNNNQSNDNNNVNDNGGDNDDGNTSACIFLEQVQGCTLRSFINMTNNHNDDNHSPPPTKKVKVHNDNNNNHENNTTTRIDDYAKRVAHETGIAIGKMHNINIIHGDLTTSNILLRNPLPPPPSSSLSSSSLSSSSLNKEQQDWKPDIVIIDFGLSSTSVNKNTNTSASCHEERAVDLYVLERAFITTHVGGEVLVDEILRGYKSSCFSSDSVLQRLSQVRLRGRKRECFG